MTSREVLAELESGLRTAADAVAKMLAAGQRPRRSATPRPVAGIELSELDRARARAAAKRCGLKVYK